MSLSLSASILIIASGLAPSLYLKLIYTEGSILVFGTERSVVLGWYTEVIPWTELV